MGKYEAKICHPAQPHTYDSGKNMILIGSVVAGFDIYISALTSVGLGGIFGILFLKVIQGEPELSTR
jgi:hypothetical protein